MTSEHGPGRVGVAGVCFILPAALIVVLVAGGALAAGLQLARSRGAERLSLWWPLPLAALASAPGNVGLGQVFWVFLRIGAVLCGSGYVLLAFLQGEVVDRLGWITGQQLLDAVSIGQVTPGPVFTTATFVGYLTAGGAAIGTAHAFLT